MYISLLLRNLLYPFALKYDWNVANESRKQNWFLFWPRPREAWVCFLILTSHTTFHCNNKLEYKKKTWIHSGVCFGVIFKLRIRFTACMYWRSIAKRTLHDLYFDDDPKCNGALCDAYCSPSNWVHFWTHLSKSVGLPSTALAAVLMLDKYLTFPLLLYQWNVCWHHQKESSSLCHSDCRGNDVSSQ